MDGDRWEWSACCASILYRSGSICRIREWRRRLSPGLNLFSGHLYEGADSESFKGSGFLDFAATLRARLTGVPLTPTGAKWTVLVPLLSSTVKKTIHGTSPN